MTTQYVTTKTAQLYEAPTGRKRHMVLIFGDEVETTGPAVDGRVPAEFRGRGGFLRTDQIGPQAALELYFIDVGQGDATFIVTPGRKTILVDGGLNRRALGFLAWKYRLDQPGPPIDIDLLVLSHADADHLNGLVPIVEHPRIRVGQVVHSGIGTFATGAFATRLGDRDPAGDHLVTRHSGLADLTGLALSDDFAAWHRALSDRAVPCTAVDSTLAALDVGDPALAVDVVGPCLDAAVDPPALPWLGDDSHTINGHSVVLRLRHGGVSVLLGGDLNVEGAEHLLAQPGLAARLDAHVFKAPHHGSHEFYPPLLAAIRPQISIISSGDEPDHGHPRASFVGGVGRASRSAEPLVFSTEIAATFVEVELPPAPPGADPAVDADARARFLFKRRLHGMINVRTDGQALYAARRVATGYWWESYGPLAPAPRP